VYPRYHVLATVLVCIPLRRDGWSWSELVRFAAGAVLLDGDHYLSYVARTGDLSLRRAVAYHRGRLPRHQRYIALSPHVPHLWWGPQRPFHTPAVLAVAGLLALRWPALRPLVFGCYVHRLQDFLWESVTYQPGRR
jgi:hypothetical protein